MIDVTWNTILTFGRHNGWRLSELPDSYRFYIMGRPEAQYQSYKTKVQNDFFMRIADFLHEKYWGEDMWDEDLVEDEGITRDDIDRGNWDREKEDSKISLDLLEFEP